MVRKVVVTNSSVIPAAFKTFIKTAKSVFRVDVRDGVLGPHESLDLHLTATLDDTITHRDSLHLIVSEGDNVVVPLHAKGVGTTIFCAEDLHLVDMGPQLTSRIADRRLTLENRGRRKQRLRFVNQSIADAMVRPERLLYRLIDGWTDTFYESGGCHRATLPIPTHTHLVPNS